MRALAGIVLLAVTILSTPARGAAIARPRTIDELKARIARVLGDNGVSGVGLALVTRDGIVWAGGVGLADRERNRPVTADTLFRVGSITKSFVALALVKLSEQGRIDLNARVSDLAPELAIENRWAADAPITVAHLLEHTAGFDDMHFNESYGPLAVETLSLGAILAHNPRSRVARWRPGSRFSYANPGYTVAAYLIEKASGRPWADYVRDELLRPLGMSGAALRWTPDVDARLARGYDDGPGPVPYRAIWHHPAGNLMASPRELAALVQLWLARGRVGGRALVSPAGLARTERSETAALRGLDTDYGLGNYGETWQRARSRGHDGGIDGFISSAVYFPERGVGYVMLLNCTGEGVRRAYPQIRTLLAEYLVTAPPLPPPPVDVPEAELRRWAGHYHFANPRHQLFAFVARLEDALTVSYEGGHLVLTDPFAGARLELFPLGDDRFRITGHGGSHVRFGRDPDGRRVLVINSIFYGVEEPGWISPLLAGALRAILWLLVSALALPLAALVWRRRAAPLGWGWPLVAALSFYAVPVLFLGAAEQRSLGSRNALTIGICAATIAFAVAAAAALLQALRRLGQPLPLVVRLHRLAVALAAAVAAGYLGWYGIIGIRLWSY